MVVRLLDYSLPHGQGHNARAVQAVHERSAETPDPGDRFSSGRTETFASTKTSRKHDRRSKSLAAVHLARRNRLNFTSATSWKHLPSPLREALTLPSVPTTSGIYWKK